MNPRLTKAQFYTLSFTWGLPLTLIGCVVATVLCLLGHRPAKWSHCYYFEVGENWGGVELGVFFVKDKTSGIQTMNHECGHAIQNCYLGFLMPFIVSVPSAIRYWYRQYLRSVKKVETLPAYDSIWFEGQATKLGKELFNWLAQENERKINE